MDTFPEDAESTIPSPDAILILPLVTSPYPLIMLTSPPTAALPPAAIDISLLPADWGASISN